MRTLTYLVLIIILFACFVIVSQDAGAQVVPSYTDSSTGLPTADLWVTKLVFFDIDEDGDQDMIALGPRKGNAAKNMHVWKWGGSSWAEGTTTEGVSNIDHSSYGGFAFADFDNDDDWDIAAGSHGADDVNAYSKFAAATYLDSSTGLDTAEDAWNIEFGDYNSDGDMDILETGFWGMDTRPFAGNGLGTWLDQSSGLPSGSTRVDGYFCDVNNDGNLDIIATWSRGDWVYIGDGNGSWTNSSNGLPRSALGFGRGINYGDFNNDGFIDLAMSVGSQTLAYAGDGTGNWTNTSAGLPQHTYSSLLLADMNNDDLDDLVGIIQSDPGVVELYLYTGLNSWVKADSTTMQGNAKGWRVGVGDFDNNGHMDIAAGFGTDDVAGYPGSIKVWRESTAASDLGVKLLYPDGGEMFKQGSTWLLKWISEVPSTSTGIEIELEYSTDGDNGPWTSIATGLPNSGVYQWDVPDVESDDCFLRITITDSGSGEESDTNENAFGIGVAAGGSGERESHDPITISSDAEWTAANGVRSGSGTEADPYIIELWDIRGEDSTCIAISDTRRYAVIRDCHLHNTSGMAVGINLDNVENITIEENDIDHTHHGVHVGNSEFLLRDNKIIDIEARGVMVSGEENRMTAIGNTLRDTGAYGFNLDGSGAMWWAGQWKYPALLENNTISGASHGIHLKTASGTFRGNIVKDCYYGVHCTLGKSFDRAVNCTFEDNVLRDNQHGMFVSLTREPLDGGRSWSIIRGNRFERNVVKGLNLASDGDYTVENNTVAMNPVGIDDIAFGNRTYRNNTIKYNLGGLILRSIWRMDPNREKVQLAEIIDNDILNNAYYGIRSDYHNYPGEVSGNHYGGVPGEDGDLLDGHIGGDHEMEPNDPDTPAIASSVTVVDDGETISLTANGALDTSYFVRNGGAFELDGADIDLQGHWIAGKIGSYLNTSGGSLSNGLTLAVATDHAMIEGTSFDNMAAGVSVYRTAPFIGNITVTNDNGTFDTSGTVEHVKFLLRRAGIYLYRDSSTILGGTLNTGGAFGIYAMYSEASIKETSITGGNDYGVGVREGRLTLEGLEISMCSLAGIANDDDWWKYGNMTIDIEGCDLQNNDIGIELAYGIIEGEGTPHDVLIANNTIDGGNTGLYLEIEDSLIIGNDLSNNGVHLTASRTQLMGNTISTGSGLTMTGDAIRLENNTFEQNTRGMTVSDSTPIVVNNDFVQNQYGIFAQDTAQPKLKFNNFEDNVEYAVYNDDSSTLVNATLNWWDSATGPGGEGSGDGDDVSEYVAFEPWLLVESDHNGHYENVRPDMPVILTSVEGYFLRIDGRTRDSEGDIVRSVELKLENGTFSTGWVEANGSWRDVRDRGGYAHAFDTFELEGGYDVSVRCFDGNDHSPVATTKASFDHPKLEDHSPIVIEGNGGFTSGNGVRSGSGTAEDPYIIERWDISSSDTTAISISDTTSYVLIHRSNLHGDDSHEAIHIDNSVNVVVEDCRFFENGDGVRVTDGSEVAVTGSFFTGPGGDDIYTRDSIVNVSDSVFLSEQYPLHMLGGPEVPSWVEGSLFITNAVYTTDLNLTFVDNVVVGGQLFGGSSTGDPNFNFNISYNVFAHGTAGVWFNSANVTLDRNLIVDHTGWGVWGDRTEMTLRENNIFGNRDGVENGDDSTTIDARRNWWGASNGPSGEGSGDGDTVSEDVEFDPWLTEPVIFNNDPSLVIEEPDGVDDTVDTSFMIVWNATDADGDHLTVDLYWDDDTDPSDRVLIAEDLGASGSHEWDTGDLDEGDYYIYGTVEDGEGGAASAYSSGPLTVDHPPDIKLTTPPDGGAEADENYTVEWSSFNASDDATVELYYDDDRGPDDVIDLIAGDIDDDGTHLWDLTDVQEGDYYVYAIITDGDLSSDAYSEGKLTVEHTGGAGPQNHRPTIVVHDPEPDTNNTADEWFTITWTADDEDGDRIWISLKYDIDDKVGGGVNITDDWIDADVGELTWDTEEVPEDEYYIYALVKDVNGSTAHTFSEGTVIVVHPDPGENTAPTIAIDTPSEGSEVSGVVWINGSAHDTDGNDDIVEVRIKIGDRTWKSVDGTDKWSFEWDTAAVDNGPITISLEVEDRDGAVGTDEIDLIVDNFVPGPPWIDISWPSDGAIVSGIVNITGTAGGDREIDEVTLTFAGYDVDVSGTEVWYAVRDTSFIVYQNVTIVATVEDAGGGTDATTVNVTVDNRPVVVNEPPTIEFTDGPKNVRAGQAAEFKLEVGDPDGIDDIATVWAKLIDDGGDVVLEVPSRDISWDDDEVTIEIDTRDLSGEYVLNVFVMDYNVEEASDTMSFEVVAKSGGDDDDDFPLWMVLLGAVILIVIIAMIASQRRRSRAGQYTPEYQHPVGSAPGASLGYVPYSPPVPPVHEAVIAPPVAPVQEEVFEVEAIEVEVIE